MKLCHMYPSISHEQGLFGIDSSIKDVELLLGLDSTNDVRMIGIWGMGGIGKTTIASKVFDKIKKKFHGHCFVSNVRETLSTSDRIISLREKIIHELLGDDDIKVDSSYSVDDSIRRRIKRTKVLLVLDDMSTSTQLKSLLEISGLYSSDSFCPGSRIIVTSRDSQVLRNAKLRSDIYEAKELKDIEAIHLLCLHAFGQNNPEKGYEKLAEKVVRYAHGVPLALVVLGCELKQKATSHWEDALKKFSTISPHEIQKILRISFDGLDQDEKNIFLDIACFLKGHERDFVVNMLESFGFHAKIGIDRLIDKSLLKEAEGRGVIAITMHDLFEQMGKEIVSNEKESNEHGSRLWNFDDIKDALTNNRGTKNVEAIFLQGWCSDDEIEINPGAFRDMCKLRFLKFVLSNSIVYCPVGLEFLPKSIKYLHWDYFPQNYWPPSFNSEKLVELHLEYSKLEEIIWSKPFVSLKFIRLSGSENLTKISDLTMAPNLEVVDLSDCDSLVEVGSSLETLNKLTKLNVKRCTSLSHLPELPYSIKEMELSSSGLRQLPTTIVGLTQLKQLSLCSCSKLVVLPSSLSLEVLDLRDCSGLIEIGSSLENLMKLTRLDVRGCRSLSFLPEIPSSIVELLLSSSGLKQLPSTIGNLTRLIDLSFDSCVNLESLPSSFCNLTSLETLDLSNCRSLRKLPEGFGNLKSLKELDTFHSGLVELPSTIGHLTRLIELSFASCENLETLPSSFCNLAFLERLDLSNCLNLQNLPADFGNLKSLRELDAYESGLIKFPPSIQHLKNLITDCKLKSLPALPSNLEVFCARHCISLSEQLKSSIVELYRKKVHDLPTKIHRLCVDDSREVPKWIMFRNNCGASVSLDLQTVGRSISFVFCMVVSSKSTPCYISPMKLVATLTNEKSETYQSFAYPDEGPTFSHYWRKNTLLLLWNCNDVECQFLKKVSFGLTVHTKKEKIIKCGVHPIFHNKVYSKRTRSKDEEHPNFDYDLSSLFIE